MKKYPEKRDLGESLLGVVSEAPSREKTAACRAPRWVAGLISLAPVAAAGERLQSLASPALELPSKAFFGGERVRGGLCSPLLAQTRLLQGRGGSRRGSWLLFGGDPGRGRGAQRSAEQS